MCVCMYACMHIYVLHILHIHIAYMWRAHHKINTQILYKVKHQEVFTVCVKVPFLHGCVESLLPPARRNLPCASPSYCCVLCLTLYAEIGHDGSIYAVAIRKPQIRAPSPPQELVVKHQYTNAFFSSL